MTTAHCRRRKGQPSDHRRQQFVGRLKASQQLVKLVVAPELPHRGHQHRIDPVA
jgi:hypothetical protein